MSFAVVILAAGQGRRMRSSIPKVLHSIGGTPILERIISTVKQLNPQQIVIVHGHEGDQLKERFAHQTDLVWAHQAEQLGTGHALLQALPLIKDVERVLVLYGDVPLISSETLEKLREATLRYDLGLITAILPEPAGFGRIVRNSEGQVEQIIEEKDASPEQKQITEINTGIWMLSKQHLARWLPQLTTDNAQGEYYFPEILTPALKEGVAITTLLPLNNREVMGVNDKMDLATVERLYQQQQATHFMKQGVTLLDPNRFDVRGQLTVGQDVVIDINAIFEGEVHLGNQVKIGPNVVIKNSILHDGVHILANTVIEDAVIGADCSIGPFARVRPGTELSTHVKIGNFVEIKKSNVGAGSKINHLSYVGDASIGEGVNLGAGTITCNFDGKDKHQTIIGNRVFIGSGTQLIAPITVGEEATIGAGTTVVKDVPPHQLLHNRIEHRSVTNWNRRSSIESESDTRNS